MIGAFFDFLKNLWNPSPQDGERVSRREAEAFHAAFNDGQLPEKAARGETPEGLLRDSVIEYGTDTTRAIASLVFTGASRRHANIRFVFSHAGGTMPYLIERFFQQKRAQELAPPGRFPLEIGRAHV